MINYSIRSRQVSKTFVFEEEKSHKSKIINEIVEIYPQETNLTPLFHKYCSFEGNVVKIYHPDSNSFQEIGQISRKTKGIVNSSLLDTQIILIRYLPYLETQEDDENSQEKKDRSKERNIQQVIELIKQWRSLHFNSVEHGFKFRLNLQEAAKIVGVSKKSLDDYYYQLRVGEQYGFNFSANLRQKIGVLRNFVKQYKGDFQKEKDEKYIKHPKQLRIIEEPLVKPAVEPAVEPEQVKQESLEYDFEDFFMPKEHISFENSDQENPFTKGLMKSYEEHYYQNFALFDNEPRDPFYDIKNCSDVE